MPLELYLLIILMGLVAGSFLGALTYRLPRGISIVNANKGRSFCPKCKKTIAWFDNIPLLSYLILGGKCRNCKKSISIREPIIEFGTAAVFGAIFYFYSNCAGLKTTGSLLCGVESKLGHLTLPYLLTVALALIIIFAIDFEHQVILDEITFFLFTLSFTVAVLFFPESFYIRLFSAFTAASSLLFLHIITKGRGMGLGDVKFCLFGGLFLSGLYTIIWLFLSFIIGALVGVVLLLAGKAKIGRQIPFGPFLVAALFITLFFGDYLLKLFLKL